MAIGVTSGRGLQFTYRSTTGENSIDVRENTFIKAPNRVRVSRSGDTFSAFTSPDNVNWTQLGTSRTINMGSQALLGMFSTQNIFQPPCTATFDNVAVTTARTPNETWRQQKFTAGESQTVVIRAADPTSHAAKQFVRLKINKP